MNSIIKKIPSLNKLIPVYAVIVVIVYSWALLHFFWRLPSLLYYSSVGDILLVLAYMLTVNLLESVLVLLATVMLSILLPAKWFYEHFVVKGALLVILGVGYLLYFNKQIRSDLPFPYELAKWTPVIFVAILALVLLLGRMKWVLRIMEELTDRLTIFLYLAIPLSMVSVLVVVVRNIL